MTEQVTDKLLERDPETYYKTLLECFATDGWKLIREDLRKEIYHLQADALEQKTWDDVNVLRGRAQAYAYIDSLEEIVQNSYGQWRIENLDATL